MTEETIHLPPLLKAVVDIDMARLIPNGATRQAAKELTNEKGWYRPQTRRHTTIRQQDV